MSSALLALREAVTVASWPAGAVGWTVESDPCSPLWTGVVCQLGLPTSVDMSALGLVGQLPANLAFATTLQSLQLSDNYLTGSLPPAWSQLNALTLLDVSSNALVGTLPDAWGAAMPLLRQVNLARNGLWSTLPAAWGTGMTGLVRLLVDNNPLL